MALKNPDLLPLFDELKPLLEPYEVRYAPRVEEPGRYELWSEVNIAPPGKPPHPVFFAGLVIQKSYVGFNYMPVYTDPDIAARLGADLMKTLKAKSCFHITHLTPELRDQIAEALDVGSNLYEAKGWV